MSVTIFSLSNGAAKSGYSGGALWQSWAEYNAGSSGPMTAYGQYQGEADISMSASFVFKDGSDNPLVIADGGMSNISMTEDGQAKFIFSPVIDGESIPSTWFSTNRMRNWVRYP